MQRANTPSGSIYDLGYRPYEGNRLGRAYAVRSLYWYTLRSIYGLGRSAMAKVFPFGLAGISILPAILQIGIAAVSPEDFEIVSHEDHFRYIRVVVALFCAVTAPELTGRDQRARTLTLYFSRALARSDYVAAKLAALVTALFLLNFIPQALLLLGNAVATENVSDYLQHNLDDFAPIIASSVAISFVMGSLSMAIASQSPRRAISTVSVLGFYLISLALSDILVHTLSGSARGFSLFVSPMSTLDGFIYWVFGATPQVDTALRLADQSGGAYLLVCIAYVVASAGWLFRRYQRMSV